MKPVTLFEIQPWTIAIIIILVLLAIVGVIIAMVPAFKLKSRSPEETQEVIATEEVNEIIVQEKPKTEIQTSFEDEAARNTVLKKEKELGLVFMDEDIDSLIIQAKQDMIDDGRK